MVKIIILYLICWASSEVKMRKQKISSSEGLCVLENTTHKQPYTYLEMGQNSYLCVWRLATINSFKISRPHNVPRDPHPLTSNAVRFL